MKREADRNLKKKREKNDLLCYLPRIDSGPVMCLQAIFVQGFN